MPGADEKVVRLPAPCNLANMRTTGKQPRRSLGRLGTRSAAAAAAHPASAAPAGGAKMTIRNDRAKLNLDVS